MRDGYPLLPVSSDEFRPPVASYEQATERSAQMLGHAEAFNGFAVPDLAEAQRFYGEVLGLETELMDEQNGLMALHHPGGRDTLVYVKPDHQPATYTILNFNVDDIDTAVDGLAERGVEFERYGGFDQDEKGIARGRSVGRGPDIAWFTDPAGNILSVLQE
jgi:predicted enzyme related to lactoylglutathione lyase